HDFASLRIGHSNVGTRSTRINVRSVDLHQVRACVALRITAASKKRPLLFFRMTVVVLSFDIYQAASPEAAMIFYAPIRSRPGSPPPIVSRHGGLAFRHAGQCRIAAEIPGADHADPRRRAAGLPAYSGRGSRGAVRRLGRT